MVEDTFIVFIDDFSMMGDSFDDEKECKYMVMKGVYMYIILSL